MDIQAIRDAFRVQGYAVVDFAASAAALAWLARRLQQPTWTGFAAVLPVTIASHALTGTDTPLTRQFFDPEAHLGVKLATLACVYALWRHAGLAAQQQL